MITLKIKVTKDILEKSKMCGVGYQGYSTQDKLKPSENCAIALAVRDIFPNASVGYNEIIFDVEDKDSDWTFTTAPMFEFISEFDRATPMERPFLPEKEFELKIPDAVIEKINIEELMPILKNHPTLELIQK